MTELELIAIEKEAINAKSKVHLFSIIIQLLGVIRKMQYQNDKVFIKV